MGTAQERKGTAEMIGKYVMFILFALSTVVAGSKIVVETKTVDVKQQFQINVTLQPTEPVKAFEFSVSYDPKMIEVNSIVLGSFFNRFASFNSPTMRIEKGSIKDIYSLIVGKGNTTNNGTLLIINATALTNGITKITLVGMGITNETMYLPLDVVNGEITAVGETYQPEPPAPDIPDIPELPDEPDEQDDNQNIEPEHKTTIDIDFTAWIIALSTVFFIVIGIKLIGAKR